MDAVARQLVRAMKEQNEQNDKTYLLSKFEDRLESLTLPASIDDAGVMGEMEVIGEAVSMTRLWGEAVAGLLLPLDSVGGGEGTLDLRVDLVGSELTEVVFADAGVVAEET